VHHTLRHVLKGRIVLENYLVKKTYVHQDKCYLFR